MGRLLSDAARRATILGLAASLSATTSPASIFSKLFGGGRPVDGITFERDADLALERRALLVLPFENAQGGEPRPPDFALHLRNALIEARAAREIALAPESPWDALPLWRQAALTPTEKRDLSRRAASERGFDVVIEGRSRLLLRRIDRGLILDIEMRLIETSPESAGRVLWHGVRRFESKGECDPDACLFDVARAVVAEWLAPLDEAKKDSPRRPREDSPARSR